MQYLTSGKTNPASPLIIKKTYKTAESRTIRKLESEKKDPAEKNRQTLRKQYRWSS